MLAAVVLDFEESDEVDFEESDDVESDDEVDGVAAVVDEEAARLSVR